MKHRLPIPAILSVAVAALIFAMPSAAAPKPQATGITGQYIEARTADVYTGPCFANSETNLVGKQAVMAWHITRGTWGNVALDGMSVVAVVRANATIGDPYTDPLPAKTLFIVDQNASDAQRAALVNFAQAQGGALLSVAIGIQAAPIHFASDIGGHMGAATLTAGNFVHITSRDIDDNDQICHNEDVYYPPLAANLTHSMPAVATQLSYTGNQLGVTWSESYRRGVFVGAFTD